MALSQFALPQQLAQAAASYQLGNVTGVYKTSIKSNVWGAILGLGLGGFFGYLALNGLDARSIGGAIIVGILALVCLFSGIYAVASAFTKAGQQIYLFERGLAVMRKGQGEVFPWARVIGVWQKITNHYRNGRFTGTTYQYKLRRDDQHEITLDNDTASIAQLGTIIVENVTRELLPRALTAFHAGQALAFDAFSINQQGITYGGKFLPWQQVQQVTVQQGYVQVQEVGRRGNWARAEVGNVQNFFIFKILSDQILKLHKR
jgi:hypothetical protein